jgi:hypothetical protein
MGEVDPFGSIGFDAMAHDGDSRLNRLHIVRPSIVRKKTLGTLADAIWFQAVFQA